MFSSGWLCLVQSSIIFGFVSAICLSFAITIFNRLLHAAERVVVQSDSMAYELRGPEQAGSLSLKNVVARFATAHPIRKPSDAQLILASWIATLCWIVLTGDNYLWSPSILQSTLNLIYVRFGEGGLRVPLQMASALGLLLFIWWATIRWQLNIKSAPAVTLATVHCCLLLLVGAAGCGVVVLMQIIEGS